MWPRFERYKKVKQELVGEDNFKSLEMNFRLFIILAAFLMCSCVEKPKDSREQDNDDVSVHELVEKKVQKTFDPTEHPLIFRRTTLIVRDIDKSLALYRDAIGMEVIYDNIIKRKHPTEEGNQEIRLIFLKAQDNFYGVLGLVDYEFNKKDKVNVPVRKEGFGVQNSILLFNTNDLELHFEKIKNTVGVEIITEPSIRKYPSYDGNDIIEVMVSTFYDPDGFLVEYNQPLTKINID